MRAPLVTVPDHQEVAPGIHRIDTPLGDRFASLYLIEGPSSLLLYDTGIDGTIPAHVLPVLSEIGRDPTEVSAVVVSHCDVDHFGGLSDAREQFPNARLVAGSGDRELIEHFPSYLAQRARGFLDEYAWDEDAEVLEWVASVTRTTTLDGEVANGESFDLGGGIVAVVRAVPGHSHGHVALDVPSADAIMIGDAILGASVDTTTGQPAFPPTYRFVDDYLATIDSIVELGRSTLLTAHYPTMSGAAAMDFLITSQNFVARLDELVVAVLSRATEGLTLAELLRALNPAAGSWPESGTEGALAFPVVGHIERLRQSGRVTRSATRSGVPVWSFR